MVKASRRAGVKTTNAVPPRKPRRPATTFIPQTEAKSRFLTHCRHVIETGEFVCVLDQSEEAFLTITNRRLKGEFVTRSAQFFKDNFSKCSSLLRVGVAFQLTLRGSEEFAYVRRHTSYKDPLDEVVDEWREKIVTSALADADGNAIARLARDFATFVSRQDLRVVEDRETARNHYETLVRSIARMAIGHKPFSEGMMANSFDPVPMRPRSEH